MTNKILFYIIYARVIKKEIKMTNLNATIQSAINSAYSTWNSFSDDTRLNIKISLAAVSIVAAAVLGINAACPGIIFTIVKNPILFVASTTVCAFHTACIGFMISVALEKAAQYKQVGNSF